MKAMTKVTSKKAPARWRIRFAVILALYVANLMSELRQNSIVPQLLSRDPELIRALDGNDFSLSTARLLSFVEEIGAASLMLLDVDGRAVAATDRNRMRVVSISYTRANWKIAA